MMRILHVGNIHSASVGTRTAAEELGAELQRRGVEVLTTSAHRAALLKVGDMVSTVLRRRHEYDVAIIDVYSGRAFRWAEAVGRTLGWVRKPFILNLVGGELPVFAVRFPDRVRRLFGRAAALTAPSGFIIDGLQPYADGIRLQPSYGLYLENYPFGLRTACDPSLVWLRAFHEVYAPWIAARTLVLLLEHYEDATLTMIGPDKRDGSFERFDEIVRAEGVADRVRIVGPVAKQAVPEHLASGDVFLNTTRAESLGVSVIEAMACGLCVVTTDVGALPGLMEDGKNGELFPPDDAEAAAEAVRRILASPDLAARLSRNARSAAERYDWSRTAAPWVELLEQVMWQ